MPTNVALVGLAKDLQKREEEGNPVRIGIVGAGEMGTDLVARIAHMSGVRVGAISTLNIENARNAVDIAYRQEGQWQEVSTPGGIADAQKAGKIPVFCDNDLLVACDQVDVVVDATGIPSVGADVGIKAMESGKHLVMMNVEADVTIGAYLRSEAERLGVVYSLGAGDEPSAAMELIEFVSAMGHPVVAAGKGKNNPLNVDATPDLYLDEARARAMNPRMLVEFVDGSKTMIEMVAIANATGLEPDIPGMHGPSVGLADLAKVLCPAEDGGVLSRKGVVDYSIGKGVAPGVFCIVEMNHPRLTERMIDLKVGDGPYFPLYRPYHLTSMEVPLSAARAVLYGHADMTPLDRPVAEVGALAKRDLQPGDRLDKIGEYTCRGFALTAADASTRSALPLGLAEGAVVRAPIGKGELLTYANCAPDADLTITRLRRRQDQADDR